MSHRRHLTVLHPNSIAGFPRGDSRKQVHQRRVGRSLTWWPVRFNCAAQHRYTASVGASRVFCREVAPEIGDVVTGTVAYLGEVGRGKGGGKGRGLHGIHMDPSRSGWCLCGARLWWCEELGAASHKVPPKGSSGHRERKESVAVGVKPTGEQSTTGRWEGVRDHSGNPSAFLEYGQQCM